MLVDAGQRVQKGQVLARLDRAVQVQQVAQLAAGVRQSEADARLAEANLNRAQALVSKGFISKADIDQRTATRDGAVARVAVAKAQLAESQERLNRLDIRAPASGLLLSRTVETGQVVGPGIGRAVPHRRRRRARNARPGRRTGHGAPEARHAGHRHAGRLQRKSSRARSG